MITYCFADIRLHVDDAEERGSADISKEKLEPLLTKTDFAVLLQIMNGKRNYMPYAPTYSTLQMLWTHALENNRGCFPSLKPKNTCGWQSCVCLGWCSETLRTCSLLLLSLMTCGSGVTKDLISPLQQIAKCWGRMHMESWCSSSPLLTRTPDQATGAQGLCKARAAHQEGHILSRGSFWWLTACVAVLILLSPWEHKAKNTSERSYGFLVCYDSDVSWLTVKLVQGTAAHCPAWLCCVSQRCLSLP